MPEYPKINELDLYMWHTYEPEYTTRHRTWLKIAQAIYHTTRNLYRNNHPRVVEPLGFNAAELDIINEHLRQRSRVLCAVYIIAWERAYGSDEYNRVEQEDTDRSHITEQDRHNLCPAFFQGLKWMLKGRHRTDYGWNMIPKHYPDALWEEMNVDKDDFIQGLPRYTGKTLLDELNDAIRDRQADRIPWQLRDFANLECLDDQED